MNDSSEPEPFDFTPTDADASSDFLIVGIGASAGGIKALKEFFTRVSPSSGMAYVVILHLSPDHDSQLAEVLQSATSIPVTQVVEMIRVEPNHVYVIPPNKSLTMKDDHLDVSAVVSIEVRRAPVDLFFRTLAQSVGQRAVAVVLSGTGANGSMGIKRVKELGGCCIVQDPLQAEYDDMPRHSLATGLIDFVMLVAEIPRQILAYRDQLKLIQVPTATPDQTVADGDALRDIFTQLRVRTGHDFSNYKRATILRRIGRRMGVNELASLSAYSQFMHDHPQEANALLKDLLISVTHFFRDREAFEKLEQDVVPKLFKGKTAEDQVRVWVAGCATGEEAYSVMMILADYAATLHNPPKIQLFATDIDEDAIAAAREGYYTLNDAADVSPERLSKYFQESGGAYRVRREMRERILFAVHNIIKDPPFAHLDLATCRNLLIYLNQLAQKRVLNVLHFALNPGGYLLLGGSESLEGVSDLYTGVDKDHRIFQGRTVETRLAFPIPDVTGISRLGKLPEVRRVREFPNAYRSSYGELHQRLLERYAPPSVVVNETYEIVHMSETAGRYMELRGGEPSSNLLDLIRPELRLELRSVLYHASQKKTDVESRGVPVRVGEQVKIIDLRAKPVFRDTDISRGFILVLFEEAREATAEEQENPRQVSAEDPIAQRLEEELQELKQQLATTIEHHELQQEELKASNEELQAMNEEMRSTAEELETSKEELQSINEELTTVNQELKIKIEELAQSNDDFKNLIDSTEIGTVFLDRDLRIKLFTSRARDVFNLIPSDVGRPLSDITSKFDDTSLISEAEKVLETLETAAHEIRTRDGHALLMQIVPYRAAKDRISGVIITFFDITRHIRSEAFLRQSEEQLHLIMQSVNEYAIIMIDPGNIITAWNTGAVKMFGYAPTEAIGQSCEMIFTPEDLAADVPAKEMLNARVDDRAADERWHLRKDGTRFYVSGVMSPMRIGGSISGYIKIGRDLTEQRRAVEDLAQARESLEEKVRERTQELARANVALRDEVTERIRIERGRVRLLRQIVRTQEDERHRIARDIHDHLGQRMTALRLNLEAMESIDGQTDELRRKLEQAKSIAEQLDSEVDFLAWELRPAALDEVGLVEAIGNYVRQWSNHTKAQAEFHSSGLETEHLQPEIETTLYRITQEALNNIMKHARATHANVLLERRDHQMVLIVEDNGVGFDPQKTVGSDSQGNGDLDRGLGLVGMRERAELVGGTLEIESKPGEGTTMFARLPIKFLEEESEVRK